MNGFTSGRLFEPKTQSLNDKVFDESKAIIAYPSYKWIGIIQKGGSWVYTSSGTVCADLNWLAGQPNNSPRECGTLVHGKWYDRDCNTKQHFICEFV